LEVISVDTSVRLSALDEANHQRQLGALRANCAIARGLGARYLRVFAGQVPEEGDRGAALDAIAAGLREGAAETASQGVTCLLETHDSFSTSDSVIDLYERGAGDDLMVLWDSLHTFRHGESVAESWAKLGSRVRHVHIKDSSRSSAESFDLVLTGTGSVPIPSILDVLEAARFDGYLSFEWEKAWLPEIEEPEVAIPHFARYMAAQATAT
jgi:sugar phosphate isomerase/epimerase